jgi:hypothetical protein
MLIGMGVLFALTLPGVVTLLIALAAVERFGLWAGRSILPWRRGRATVSAAGFDEFTAILYAGKRAELDRRDSELVLRDEHPDGAPPRGGIDLDRNTATLPWHRERS